MPWPRLQVPVAVQDTCASGEIASTVGGSLTGGCDPDRVPVCGTSCWWLTRWLSRSAVVVVLGGSVRRLVFRYPGLRSPGDLPWCPAGPSRRRSHGMSANAGVGVGRHHRVSLPARLLIDRTIEYSFRS